PTHPNTATSTPSLHDALPISAGPRRSFPVSSPAFRVRSAATIRLPIRPLSLRTEGRQRLLPASTDKARSRPRVCGPTAPHPEGRSEEHTSELQSRENLVCRLL